MKYKKYFYISCVLLILVAIVGLFVFRYFNPCPSDRPIEICDGDDCSCVSESPWITYHNSEDKK